ncbi:MAG: hypothetical protein RXN79_02720 [Candidatus Nanopusillus sp.]
MVRCPFCGSEDLTLISSWKYGAFDVSRYKCNKCGNKFNYYKGKNTEFYIPKPKDQEMNKEENKEVDYNHEEVKSWLQEIGEVLGYYAYPEYADEPYRFDIVYKLFNSKKESPVAVFEVVDSNTVDTALSRLSYAYKILKSKGLYLIVLDNKYKERAKKLLENTHPEIKDKVEILDANKIKELRDILNKYGDDIKKLINLGK